MGRRLAVHARGHTQALTRAQLGWRAWMLAALVVSLAGVADAKPKRRDAKAAFDRGVAAYKKAAYEAAAEALGKSFELEHDVDTLFAWAQAERKLDHCAKAIDLYEKLLASDLPPANHSAVEVKLAECRAVLAAQVPKEAPPVEPKPVEPQPEPTPEPAVPPPLAAPARPAEASSPAPVEPSRAGRSWYQDPVALSLVGGGLVATGVGAGLLVSASSLDSSVKTARTYNEAKANADKAKSRGNLGLIATGVGGGLVVAGLVWIAIHGDSDEQHPVTGFVVPGGGGLAWGGGF